MPECSFCKKMYDVPRGTTYVLPNGDLLYFCSSKCLKNDDLGRIGKKATWVRKAKKSNKTPQKEEQKEVKEVPVK